MTATTHTVSGHDRVMQALSFQEPDRVPQFVLFWPEFIDAWRQHKHLAPEADPIEYYDLDMIVVAADETPWPTKAKVLRQSSAGTYTVCKGRLSATSECY